MSENNIIDVQICPEEENCLGDIDKASMPSVMQMAKNLMSDGSKVISNALQGNKTLASDAIREHRWSTCLSCEHLQENRCSKCGCFMKVKVALATSKCPIDKWN